MSSDQRVATLTHAVVGTGAVVAVGVGACVDRLTGVAAVRVSARALVLGAATQNKTDILPDAQIRSQLKKFSPEKRLGS